MADLTARCLTYEGFCDALHALHRSPIRRPQVVAVIYVSTKGALMSTKRSGTGLVLGYARISTLEQNEDFQRDALTKAGCVRLYIDKASGQIGPRPALDTMLDQLRAGYRAALMGGAGRWARQSRLRLPRTTTSGS